MCREEREDAPNTEEENVKTWFNVDLPLKVNHAISQKPALGSTIFGYLVLSALLCHAGEIPPAFSNLCDI